jgi:hypothetical protein
MIKGIPVRVPIFSRYHLMVFFNPSRKEVWALNPNSGKALFVSSILRGWPSGLVRSQMIRPLKPVNSMINSASSFWASRRLKLRYSLDGGREGGEGVACEKFLFKAFIFDYTDLKNLENGLETE